MITQISHLLLRHLTQLGLQDTISYVASVGTRLPLQIASAKTTNWWNLLAVCGLAGFAVLLRCLRLFDSSTNVVYNIDSHFFHWLGQRVMAGEGPPLGTSGANYTLHSGFAYPAAYIAKALGFVFHLSPTDSLDIAFKFLPPAIAVISVVVLYLAVSRILNRRVAFFSALTWAMLFDALFIGAAGNLDRDALTALLLMVGALAFYLFRSQRLNLGNRDVGWIFSGLSVLLIQVLLYLEWGLQGAAALLAVIFIYSGIKLVSEYSSLLEKEPKVRERIATALRRSDLRAFVLVAAINILALGLFSHQFGQVYTLLVGLIRGRLHAGTNVYGASEEQGLSFADVLRFQFFLVPIALGIYLAWKQRNDAMLFFASWFAAFLIISVFVWRVIWLMVPATCVVSGIGLAYLWGIMLSRDRRYLWRQLGILVLAILLVLISSVSAVTLNGNNYIMAADKDWQQALSYLRESTPQDAVIMSQWSYGYWILDVAQREPFVDNGYYGYTIDKLQSVGSAYCTPDPSQAAAIMRGTGATYLVFAKQDLDVAKTIMGWAGLNTQKDTFPDDSLVVRSLDGQFLSGGGLELVFKNNETVILGLAQPGQTRAGTD